MFSKKTVASKTHESMRTLAMISNLELGSKGRACFTAGHNRVFSTMNCGTRIGCEN